MSITKMTGFSCIFLILLVLSVSCEANNINILGSVSPNSGVEGTDFTYSAVIKFTHDDMNNPDIREPLNVSLILSDGSVSKSFKDTGKFPGGGLSPDELIKMESNPFVFGPYLLSEHGLKDTDNLSYEFILTTASEKELAREKNYGPKIVKFNIEDIQYSKIPSYYFLPFPITIVVSDKPNLLPSIQLSFQGPLNSSEETAWSGYMDMRADGTTYTFSQPIDLSQFSQGGTFRFNFTYTNSTYDDTGSRDGYGPTTLGPFMITIKPYSPRIAEPLALTKQLEYNNFSLKVLVEDDGATIMGNPVGCSASLVINHPNRGELVFNNSQPIIQGKYIVFEWDKSSVPFNRSDVLQSRKAPLKAHMIYWNENRKYGANSTEYILNLVDVIPYLVLEHDPVIHLAGNESNKELIRATVTYARGMGDLKIISTGPKGSYESILKGSAAGSNRYQYEWEQEFNRSQAGNYTLSFTYLHDSLEGGRYEFEQKPEYSFSVVPIIIKFQNGSVTPTKGMWNGTYSYSVEVDSSVEADAVLEIFNPCSSEWKDLGIERINPDTSNISWVIQPFSYNCNDLMSGKYRFRASFMRRDFSPTEAYEGPKFNNEENEPKLIEGLNFMPVLFVSADKESNQNFYAKIYSSIEGILTLNLSGMDKEKQIKLVAKDLGKDIYEYYGMEPFNASNANKNYTISLDYLLEGQRYNLGRYLMQVSLQPLQQTEKEDDHTDNGSDHTGRMDDGPLSKDLTNKSVTEKATEYIGGDFKVIGKVSPARAIIQEWDEKDSLNELTYSFKLENWTSGENPWVTLFVKPNGSSWKSVGEVKEYDPTIGEISWTIKPFWDTPFLGVGKYKFLINNMESQEFEGPEIVARYRAADSWTGHSHNFVAVVSSSVNLTVCLLGGDNRLPENINNWTIIDDCKGYVAGSGEQNISWTIPESRPLYYDFDVKIDEKVL